VVATTDTASTPPRVKVDITDSGTPAITSVTVTRQNAAGAITPVRTSDGGPLQLVTSGSNRVATVYDYEAPYGLPVTYSTLEYPSGVSATVTLAVTVPWLVHIGVPARSQKVTIRELAARTRTVNRGVFEPMGRANPVIVTDGRRKGATSKLQLWTDTDAGRRAMDTLLDDASVLFLNLPASKTWGMDSSYIAVGDFTETRLTRLLAHQDRVWDLPFNVVDRPVGGQQATYVWADVLAKYPTWQALIDANATWAAVQVPS
jgi:hypothetical protein